MHPSTIRRQATQSSRQIEASPRERKSNRASKMCRTHPPSGGIMSPKMHSATKLATTKLSSRQTSAINPLCVPREESQEMEHGQLAHLAALAKLADLPFLESPTASGAKCRVCQLFHVGRLADLADSQKLRVPTTKRQIPERLNSTPWSSRTSRRPTSGHSSSLKPYVLSPFSP